VTTTAGSEDNNSDTTIALTGDDSMIINMETNDGKKTTLASRGNKGAKSRLW
jgi:hypothetical protein